MNEPEGVVIARVGARYGVVISLVGALVAIVTTLLTSDAARLFVRTLSWPQREAKLLSDLEQATTAQDQLTKQLDTLASQVRDLSILNAALQRDVQRMADQRTLPPPRMAFTYIKYDATKTNCLLAASAALRLATNSEPESISSGALYSISGTHKVSVLCYDSDGLAMFLALGPELNTVSALRGRVVDEFLRVTGIK
jgi:hypothetical protein